MFQFKLIKNFPYFPRKKKTSWSTGIITKLIINNMQKKNIYYNFALMNPPLITNEIKQIKRVIGFKSSTY